MRPLRVELAGRLPHREAMETMAKRVEAVRTGAAPDTLFLLEHPPVITLGRSARSENLRASPEALRARGIDVVEVARGGDVTLHAPGQLVGYLVCDLAARGLADVGHWLRGMEQALVRALAALGLAAETWPGRTGVYVAGTRPDATCETNGAAPRARKIASIGVGVRSWISSHGFAINGTIDLSLFETIVACGLHDVEMTSLAHELGEAGRGRDLDCALRESVAQAMREWLR